MHRAFPRFVLLTRFTTQNNQLHSNSQKIVQNKNSKQNWTITFFANKLKKHSFAIVTSHWTRGINQSRGGRVNEFAIMIFRSGINRGWLLTTVVLKLTGKNLFKHYHLWARMCELLSLINNPEVGVVKMKMDAAEWRIGRGADTNMATANA